MPNGDAGEGLIDAEAGFMNAEDPNANARTRACTRWVGGAPAPIAEALRLARRELEAQLTPATHERRRVQIEQAIAELDRRMAAAEGLNAEGVLAPTKG